MVHCLQDFILFNRDPSAVKPARFALWLLQSAFACTVVSIVSGAMAERARLVAHIMYAAVMAGWIYPVVVHWVWSSEGML